MTVDLGGHGDSEGDLYELSLRDHLNDAVAAFDRVASEDGVDQSRVGVCGASYGGYLAGQLVRKRPASRLFLRAPALYDDAAFDVPMRERSQSSVPQAAGFLGGLASYRGAIMVLEGGKDEVVSHDTIERYLAAAPRANHQVIPDATHELSRAEWNDVFVEAVIDWFRPR